MSTSLLYHGFSQKNQEYLKTEYSKGSVIFHIRTNPFQLCCSSCGSANVIRKGFNRRQFKTLPIGKLMAHLTI